MRSDDVTLTFPEGAVARDTVVTLQTNTDFPLLSPDYHPRRALSFTASAKGSVNPIDPTEIVPELFHFNQPVTLAFSYATYEDPDLSVDTYQVRQLATFNGLWIQVPAEFDRDAKIAKVTVWFEGTYVLVANAGLIPLKPVSVPISSKGGSLDFGRLHVEFPENALGADAKVTASPPRSGKMLPWQGGLPFPFELIAETDSDGTEIHELRAPVTLSIAYSDQDIGNVPIDRLTIRSLDESTGRWEDLVTRVDPTAHTITAFSPHLSTFTVGSGDSADNPFDFGTSWVRSDEFRGAASFAMPFELPPVTGGMVPDLKLVYSSQSSHWAQRGNNLDGNNGGKGYQTASWVGEGFDIPIGYVQQTTDPNHTPVQYYYSASMFGQGARLVLDTSTTTWHTEDEQFWKIDKDGSETVGSEIILYKWRIILPNGTKYYFGIQSVSQLDYQVIYDFSTPGQKGTRFMLSRVLDPQGYWITIDYLRLTKTLASGGSMTPAVYPTTISYGGSNSGLLPYSIAFVRSGTPPIPMSGSTGVDRADVNVSNWINDLYQQLFFDTNSLSRLDVKVSGSVARSYKFTYENGIPMMLSKVELWSEASGIARQTVLSPMYTDPPMSDTDSPVTAGTGPTVTTGFRFLASLTNGFGGTFSFQYAFESVANFSDYQGWSRILYKGRALVVTQATSNPGFGGAAIVRNYSPYLNAEANNNPSWPDFEGHSQVTCDSPGFYHSVTNFLQGVRAGRISEKYEFAPTDWINPLRSVGNTWSATTMGGISNWVHLDQADFYQVSGHKKTTYLYATGQQGGTQYGNLTDSFEYDVNQSATNWIRRTSRWLYPGKDANHYVVNRVAMENVYGYDGSAFGVAFRSTLSCYDTATAWNTAIGAAGSDASYRGRLTTLRRNANLPSATPQYFDTTYEYDAAGNRTVEKKWNGYGTLSQLASALTSDYRAMVAVFHGTYSAFRLNETTPSDDLGYALITRYTYDYLHGGQLLTVEDPNQQITTHTYDALGRRTATWLPGDDPAFAGAATVTYRYFIGAGLPTTVQIGRRKDAGGDKWGRRAFEWAIYNGLGQVIQVQKDFDRTGAAIRAQDITDLRSGLTNDGITPAIGAVTAHTSPIQASDFTGLRANVQSLWATAGLGVPPDWSSGQIPTGGANRSPIFGSDMVDLRHGLNRGEKGSTPPKALTGFSNVAGNVSGNVVVVNRHYDGQGLLANESVPHLLALPVPGGFFGLANADWTNNSSPKTSYTYDALKRKLSRKQPDETSVTTVSFSDFTTTTIDDNGHQKKGTTDALGRLLTVKDYTGAFSGFTLLNTTTYGFDVLDRPQSILDPAGNLTTMVYDSLGRKPDQTDADLGHWIYQYPIAPTVVNPLWLIQTQIPPSNPGLQNQITFAYDRLDRVSSKAAPNLGTVLFYYDVGTMGMGRRTSMTDGAGTTTYSYDARGRVVGLSRAINATFGAAAASYSIAMTYDDLNRPLSVTYPNLDVLTYTYGDHGQAIGVSLNGQALVVSATFNPLGKVKTVVYGNGVQTTLSYYGIDQAALALPVYTWYGQLYRIQTGTFQDQVFNTSSSPWNGYDQLGNPTAIKFNAHTLESLTFSYNALDQLTAMAGTVSENYGSYLQGTTYDIDNLLSRGGTALNYGTPAPPHAPKSTTTSGVTSLFGYDANGNRLTDPTSTYVYDAENHLTALSTTIGGAFQIRNAYDGDGTRSIRAVGAAVTHYVGDSYEAEAILSQGTAYYLFNGMTIGMKKNGVLSYLHHDHLGSLVSATDMAGAELCSVRYAPFGAIRSSTGTVVTDRLFTGQIRDAGNDAFYFFKARYYDATIGKFQTADSVTPGGGNPRGLNRYAYAFNNPLKFVDPSGHAPMDPKWATDFATQHGYKPQPQDWAAYEYSQTHPGTGPNGVWTPQDWFAAYVLLPLQQAWNWTFDPAFSDWTNNPSPAYLQRHAAQLLSGWVTGKIISAAARSGLASLFGSPFTRTAIIMEDLMGNAVFTSYRGLTPAGRAATIRFLSELVGAIPITGIDETTGAVVFNALAKYAGVADVGVTVLGGWIGALIMFFASPEVAESN